MPFTDIIGQEKPANLLREYIHQKRIASSYLFIGPEGVGKKMAAQCFAKALNCEENNLDACDKCISCLKIDKGQHPDMHFIGSEDIIKIEEVRQLQREIALRPYEGKFKVFIIDNAHNLTADAANAILKVLEEPPAHSIIILVTAKPQKLFKTIISRCQVIRFNSVPRLELKEILENKFSLSKANAHFLAYFSEGRIGLALKLKDTDLLAEKDKIIDGFSKPRGIFAQDDTWQEKDEIRNYLNILAVLVRDIIINKTGLANSEVINIDRIDDLKRYADTYSFPDLERMLKAISDSLLYLEQNINTKLLLSNLNISLKG